jgi:hypothetical protein
MDIQLQLDITTRKLQLQLEKTIMSLQLQLDNSPQNLQLQPDDSARIFQLQLENANNRTISKPSNIPTNHVRVHATLNREQGCYNSLTLCIGCTYSL